MQGPSSHGNARGKRDADLCLQPHRGNWRHRPTAKRSYSAAQGRESSSAPWGNHATQPFSTLSTPWAAEGGPWGGIDGESSAAFRASSVGDRPPGRGAELA